jgi:antirestriction protein ArdC
MNNDQAVTLAERALEHLAEALTQGPSDALKRFLKTAARFHRYSFQNVMLIAWQRPTATRVAGFHTWKSLGRQVRKGETGIAILAPMRKRSADTTETIAPCVAIDTEKPTGRLLGFKVVYVFDIAQTVGKDLPDISPVKGDPADWFAKLEAVVRGYGIALTYAQNLGGADGLSFRGNIVLAQSLPPAERFVALAHELAHGLLHHQPSETPAPLTLRETEAEAVAHVVGYAVGIESTRHSADYIQLYNGDTEMLAASLKRIQATASQIIGRLMPDPRHSSVPLAA